MPKRHAHIFYLLVLMVSLTLVTALPTDLLAFGDNGFTIELVGAEDSEETEVFEDEVYIFGESDHFTFIITAALRCRTSDFSPYKLSLPVPSPPPEF